MKLDTIANVFYGNYGKYISRFRAIPYHIDILRPVERRMLLSLYDVAKNKFVKSARVVGHCMGNYHPHAEAYSTLVRIVQNGLAIGQGNWGSKGLEPDPPAAMRYTEVKLDPKIEKLAFEFIDYVPWKEFEFALEPEFLPSPIPLGLIGNTGVNQGIAFHRTAIPTYTIQTLFLALLSILGENQFNLYEMYPYVEGHYPMRMDKSIIDSGQGTYHCHPEFHRDKNVIELYGVPQNKTKLYKMSEAGDIEITDYTSKEVKIEIKCKNKAICDKIVNEILITSIKYDILFVDLEGSVFRKSIRSILEDTYSRYKDTVEKYYEDIIEKQKQKINELLVIAKIKEVLHKHKVNKVEELSKHIKDVPFEIIKQVTNKYSINRLINIQIDIKQEEDKLKQYEKDLKHINKTVVNKVKDLTKLF